jgi:hypothetical protein
MDVYRVLARRHLVRSLLRGASVVMALLGVTVLGMFVVPLTREYIGFEMWTYWAAVAAAAVIFGVPSVALGLASAWLARWIVPPMDRGCPRCGYEMRPGAPACSECGEVVGAESERQP